MAERSGRRTALRLSLQFALLYAFLCALVFLAAYLLSRYETRDWVEDRMLSEAAALTRLSSEEGPEALEQAVIALGRINFEGERIWLLKDPNGARLAGNVGGLPDTLPHFLPTAGLNLPEDADQGILGYWMREDAIGELILIQGTSDQVVFEIIEALTLSLVIGFVVLLGTGLAAGVWVGRLTGDRVAALSGALSAASSGALDARVPEHVARAPDDIGQVATEVNAALAEIEDLMEAQETVTAQVAHDLRTPMQRLRQRIDRMESLQNADREDLLGDIDAILRTFRALLTLAEISAQPALPDAVALDLGQLVREVAETYEPVIEDAGLDLVLDLPETGPALRGNRDLLAQMTANLIENTLAHARGARTLTISARKEDRAAWLRIRDDGPGIPEAEVDAVFGRFHRLDPARSSQGAGLGLPLVRAIARLHGGDARVAPSQLGAVFDIRFEAR